MTTYNLRVNSLFWNHSLNRLLSFEEFRIQFSWRRAGHENLRLTVEKCHWNLVIGSNIHAIACIKLVAKLLTWLVGVISNFTHSCHFVVVGKSNKHIAASESIERVVAPALNVRVVPHLIIFSHIDKSFNKDVKRIVWVEWSPERFTIGGIISSFESLLRSVINDWDTLGISNKS